MANKTSGIEQAAVNAEKTSETPETNKTVPPTQPIKAKKAVPKKQAAKKSPPAAKAKKKAPETKTEAKAKAAKPKASAKPKKSKAAPKPSDKKAQVLDSKVAYEGKLFRVLQDHLVEPGGRESHRDVIRHNGSVVILAVDPGKSKKDPWVVVERQYRHAAGQFLWELPAGKLDAGESALDGAKRELAEETGYQARKWSPLIEYWASPGFLGEAMKVFLAEGLVAGDAHPEEDENIDFRLVKLSELLEMIDDGKIADGKTLTSILLFARKLGLKRKK